MKKQLPLFRIVIFLFAMLFPLVVKAGTIESTLTIVLQQESSDNDDEKSEKGHRVPPRPIFCHISQSEGVQIADVNNSDIQSFEVYDENGQFINSFVDETEFISFIFMYTGIIEIKIKLSEYYLCGYIPLF